MSAAVTRREPLALATSNRSAWDEAFATFRALDAEHDRLLTTWEEAEDAAWQACPRYDEAFALGLTTDMGREEAQTQAFRRILSQSFNGVPMWPAAKREEYERAHAAAEVHAAAIADRWLVYRAKWAEALQRFNVEELQQKADAFGPKVEAARSALMAVAAPDHAALLVKLEQAALSLDEDAMQSALHDARRLLGQEG